MGAVMTLLAMTLSGCQPARYDLLTAQSVDLDRFDGDDDEALISMLDDEGYDTTRIRVVPQRWD